MKNWESAIEGRRGQAHPHEEDGIVGRRQIHPPPTQWSRRSGNTYQNSTKKCPQSVLQSSKKWKAVCCLLSLGGVGGEHRGRVASVKDPVCCGECGPRLLEVYEVRRKA